jgi:hypothetical protein
MLKDTTYKEKFVLLQDWLPAIIEAVKKDLKSEHLKQDWQFVKKYFANKNLNKLTAEELVEGYRMALAQEEKSEELAEFISNRWLLKNSEIYYFFEQALSKLNPEFSELEELDQTLSTKLMENSVNEFGAEKTYLFAVINSVVFPKKIYDQLKSHAEKDTRKAKENAIQEAEHKSIEAIHSSYQQQIARLTDKYEKKLQGLQKKYIVDTDALKKQISTLQRKLNG